MAGRFIDKLTKSSEAGARQERDYATIAANKSLCMSPH